MAIEWTVVGEIAKPLVAVILGALGKTWFERKPKVITFYGSVSTHQVSPPGQAGFKVFTHEVVLSNVGKKPATNVRLSHNILPNFHVFPLVQYKTEPTPSGGDDIVIASLLPGEHVVVSYLYLPPLNAGEVNAGIRHDDGFALPVPALMQRQLPKVLVRTRQALTFIGLVTVLYFVYLSVRWVMVHF